MTNDLEPQPQPGATGAHRAAANTKQSLCPDSVGAQQQSGQGPLPGTTVQPGPPASPSPGPPPTLSLQAWPREARLAYWAMIHCLDSPTPGFGRGMVLPEHGTRRQQHLGPWWGVCCQQSLTGFHLHSQQSWASPRAFRPTEGCRKWSLWTLKNHPLLGYKRDSKWTDGCKARNT